MPTHPTRLGKYQITELIGEGAMGVVYKAFDPDIRRVVALKTVRAMLADGDDGPGSIAARFRNEAQAAGRLSHPGIVAVHEFGRDQQVAYIAMEFVEGRSLASLLADRLRWLDDDIPGVMSQLLDALSHAHERGVWHRDVKPANIIMTRGGRLKVADFGIARIEESSLTQTQVMIGTPSHMAPEQFLGTPIDCRVDVYAAGVVLYQLLTGRAPFTGSTDSLMYRVVHEAPQPPSAVAGADRPPWYDAIVARALAKDPAQRFPSAAAFKQALATAIGHAFDETAWERTLLRAPPRPAPAAAAPAASTAGGTGSAHGAERSHRAANPASGSDSGSSGGGAATAAPTGWDPALLAQAQTALARYLGPLAGVVVRRAARDCHDLPSLYAKLAEQVTNPAARNAFLGEATAAAAAGPAAARRAGSDTGILAGTGPGTRTGADEPAAAPGVAAPVDAALLARAEAVLAEHLGPIAKVVVRRAAVRTSERGAFLELLCQAVDDPAARARVLATLAPKG
jgi:serine/threonine-protein kinase